jgi:hypothetical protein
MTPRIGQSREVKMPVNQVVKNQRMKIVRRGTMSAMATKRQGMASAGWVNIAW